MVLLEPERSWWRKATNMVDYCANPKCMKPLHYLREGTIYLFEVSDSGLENFNPGGHRLEHFWLCGSCSSTHRLERTTNQELRLVPEHSLRFLRRDVVRRDVVRHDGEMVGRVLAS